MTKLSNAQRRVLAAMREGAVLIRNDRTQQWRQALPDGRVDRRTAISLKERALMKALPYWEQVLDGETVYEIGLLGRGVLERIRLPALTDNDNEAAG